MNNEFFINMGLSFLFAALKDKKVLGSPKFRAAFIKLRDVLIAAYPPEE